MKIAKKHLSILLAIALLLGIFSVGSSVSTMAAETAQDIPYVHTYLPGIETASQELLDTAGKSTCFALTAGITDSGYVADGAASAVKITLNGSGGPGYGQVMFYSQDADKNRTAYPNGNAQNLAKADGIRFFLRATGDLPQSIRFVTVNKYNTIICGVDIPILNTDVANNGMWIELKATDFYTYSGGSMTDTKLTAFANTLAFGFITTGNGRNDGYRNYNLYFSGLSQYQKPVNTPAQDKFIHTKLTGFENISQAEAELFSHTANSQITTNITDASYVAYGENSATKFTYASNTSPNWGQTVMYCQPSGTTSSSDRYIPEGIIPTKPLSNYDGLRVFVKVVATTDKLPEFFYIRLVDAYYSGCAQAKITLDNTKTEFSGWIYLEPSDFVVMKNNAATEETLTVFPSNVITLAINTSSGNKKSVFDIYLSGMSAYVNTDIAEMRSALLGEITTNNVRHAVNGDDKVDIRDLVWLYNYTK